jgi:rare lipoprotein A
MTHRHLPFLLLVALTLLAGCASHPPGASRAGTSGGYKIGQPYQIDGVWYYPAENFSYDETGIASWYGEDFDGKPTANGEVYDLKGLSAAHRTLPMPTIVQVINLENGRSLNLRVNDRGPYARGRIIDVSRHAAQLLGFEAQGTAKVRVKILVPETLQAASLARRNAGDDMPAADRPQAAPRMAVAAQPLPAAPAVQLASTETPAAPSAPILSEVVSKGPVKPTQIYIQAGAFGVADNALKLKRRLDSLGPVNVVGAAVNGASLYRVRLGPIASVEEADRLLERVVAAGLPEARIIVD